MTKTSMSAAPIGRPMPQARHALVREGHDCQQVHNNCSGKHAGMLALARQLGVDPKDYVKREHPVQQAIARTMGEDVQHSISTPSHGASTAARYRPGPFRSATLPQASHGYARRVSSRAIASSRRSAPIPSWWRELATSTPC